MRIVRRRRYYRRSGVFSRLFLSVAYSAIDRGAQAYREVQAEGPRPCLECLGTRQKAKDRQEPVTCRCQKVYEPQTV